MINKNNVFRSLSRIISIILIFLLSVSMFPASVPVKAANSSNARVVVSLGDSYSAGEGIEDFYDQNLPTAQKVNSQDWLSHRSTKSWPGLLYINNKANNACYYLAQNRYDKSRNDQEVCWYFAAVSGAESKHLDKKQTKNYYLKDNGKVYKGSKDIDEQLAVFQTIKDNKQTVDYVTLTMGGNDVGFSEVISDIAIKSFYVTPNASANTFYEKLQILKDKTVKDLRDTYIKIHETAGEQASIIVAGYPRLFAHKYSNHISTGLLFNEIERIIVNQCVDLLNNEISKIVEELQKENIDIHFVSVTEAFDGHGAYAINPYINPVSIIPKSQDIDCRIKNEKGVNPSAYSMHPNQKGAEAYAACVQAKIDELEDNLTTTTSSTDTTVSTSTESNLNLVGTYWTMFFGPTNGGMYHVRFDDNGTVLALCAGSQDFCNGTYTYSQNSFNIELEDGYSGNFIKVNENEYMVQEPVYIANGDMMFHYEATRITDAQSIKEFEEKAEVWRNENTTTTESEIETHNNITTPFDKYGKYLKNSVEFVFEDFPNASTTDNGYGGGILHLSKSVSMLYYYETGICGQYECLATDLYPDIDFEKVSMTIEEFEIYSGVKMNSDEYDGTYSYWYCWYDDYYIEVDCESDGTIVLGESAFSVRHKEDTPR